MENNNNSESVLSVQILKLNELEKSHILNVLKLMNNNKTQTAKLLGVSLKTLYNKLEKYSKEVNNEQN